MKEEGGGGKTAGDRCVATGKGIAEDSGECTVGGGGSPSLHNQEVRSKQW